MALVIVFLGYGKSFIIVEMSAIPSSILDQGLHPSYIRSRLENHSFFHRPYTISSEMSSTKWYFLSKLFSAVLQSIMKPLDWFMKVIRTSDKLSSNARFPDNIVAFLRSIIEAWTMCNWLKEATNWYGYAQIETKLGSWKNLVRR